MEVLRHRPQNTLGSDNIWLPHHTATALILPYDSDSNASASRIILLFGSVMRETYQPGGSLNFQFSETMLFP